MKEPFLFDLEAEEYCRERLKVREEEIEESYEMYNDFSERRDELENELEEAKENPERSKDIKERISAIDFLVLSTYLEYGVETEVSFLRVAIMCLEAAKRIDIECNAGRPVVLQGFLADDEWHNYLFERAAEDEIGWATQDMIGDGWRSKIAVEARAVIRTTASFFEKCDDGSLVATVGSERIVIPASNCLGEEKKETQTQKYTFLIF